MSGRGGRDAGLGSLGLPEKSTRVHFSSLRCRIRGCRPRDDRRVHGLAGAHRKIGRASVVEDGTRGLAGAALVHRQSAGKRRPFVRHRGEDRRRRDRAVADAARAMPIAAHVCSRTCAAAWPTSNADRRRMRMGGRSGQRSRAVPFGTASASVRMEVRASLASAIPRSSGLVRDDHADADIGRSGKHRGKSFMRSIPLVRMVVRMACRTFRGRAEIPVPFDHASNARNQKMRLAERPERASAVCSASQAAAPVVFADRGGSCRTPRTLRRRVRNARGAASRAFHVALLITDRQIVRTPPSHITKQFLAKTGKSAETLIARECKTIR